MTADCHNNVMNKNQLKAKILLLNLLPFLIKNNHRFRKII